MILLRCLGRKALYPVLPRLALSAFTFSQPFLVNSMLSELSDGNPRDLTAGYGLIGATLLVYTGIAVGICMAHIYTHAEKTKNARKGKKTRMRDSRICFLLVEFSTDSRGARSPTPGTGSRLTNPSRSFAAPSLFCCMTNYSSSKRTRLSNHAP